MSGKILIVDPVSTNRIVLRVKMLAAQYIVRTAESPDEAQAMVAADCPDLVLLNLAATSREGLAFCKSLREDPATQRVAIVCVGAPVSTTARMAALAVGVDDVLATPINDAFLMARVRSLLRQRSALGDLLDTDVETGTTRHFGFREARPGFENTRRISVLCERKVNGIALARRLGRALGQQVEPARSIRELAHVPAPDVVVVTSVATAHSVVGLSEVISDLRARDITSQAAQLVIVPRWAAHQAAMALDLSADDVAFDDTPEEELALRVARLAQRKGHADRVRAALKEGLRAAVTDALTGLHNRRYADSFMQRLQQTSHHCGAGYAMILLDIDHFKGINDRLGHDAGDRVLAQVAQRLRDVCASADLCARIGGEEFMVVLTNTGMSGARLEAEKLRRAIASHPFELGTEELNVTVSVGVAVHDPLSGAMTQETGPLGPLFPQADAALYQSKSAGRDVVSCAHSAAA